MADAFTILVFLLLVLGALFGTAGAAFDSETLYKLGLLFLFGLLSLFAVLLAVGLVAVIFGHPLL